LGTSFETKKSTAVGFEKTHGENALEANGRFLHAEIKNDSPKKQGSFLKQQGIQVCFFQSVPVQFAVLKTDHFIASRGETSSRCI